MVVYGDPNFSESFHYLVEQVLQDLESLQTGTSLDESRRLLVRAGQLEQAVADAWSRTSLVEQVERITDLAAETFLSAWIGTQPDISLKRPSGTGTYLQLKQALEKLPDSCDVLNVKVPEGFSFYTLFPESYIASCLRWMGRKNLSLNDRILVIGLRSIGTTLSAVVNSTLAAAGYRSRRITVRPTGYYFDRVTTLMPRELEEVSRCVIVDEGPGLSGSSMASVAKEVIRLGLPQNRIAFLAGHNRLPGSQTSHENMNIWSGIDRFSTPFDELRWFGCSVPEILVAESSKILGQEACAVADVSAGRWRAFVYPQDSDWPPSTGSFERTKYRIEGKDGRSLVWKFAGFLTAPKNWGFGGGFNRKPLGGHMGFVATEWLTGPRMRPENVGSEVQSQLCNHTFAVAGPPLDEVESRKAKDRLALITASNVREALGKDLAKKACRLIDFASFEPTRPSYGDGRMSPDEWVRQPDGRMYKVYSQGHDCDHTIVGMQPIFWDIAATLVEWNLNETSGARFLRCLRELGLQNFMQELLFYQVAYCAFRMGQCSLVKSQVIADEAEIGRLDRTERLYREKVRSLVGTSQ